MHSGSATSINGFATIKRLLETQHPNRKKAHSREHLQPYSSSQFSLQSKESLVNIDLAQDKTSKRQYVVSKCPSKENFLGISSQSTVHQHL